MLEEKSYSSRFIFLRSIPYIGTMFSAKYPLISLQSQEASYNNLQMRQFMGIEKLLNFDNCHCHRPNQNPESKNKVKVSPIYDLYVGECLLERTLVLSHRLFEVGCQFLSSPPLSPQCFHRVPIRCWVDSERAFNHRF